MPEVGAVPPDLARYDGARADNAHVALQHVEQLRQFIQAGLAQELAQAGHARIAVQLVIAFPGFPGVGIGFEQVHQGRVGVADHRPELEAAEDPSIPADARMTKDRRAAVAEKDQGGDDQQQGGQHQQRRQSDHDVQRPHPMLVAYPWRGDVGASHRQHMLGEVELR
ncbi:hypothetical protein D3C80_1282270 [compost metagenome]